MNTKEINIDITDFLTTFIGIAKEVYSKKGKELNIDVDEYGDRVTQGLKKTGINAIIHQV